MILKLCNKNDILLKIKDKLKFKGVITDETSIKVFTQGSLVSVATTTYKEKEQNDRNVAASMQYFSYLDFKVFDQK